MIIAMLVVLGLCFGSFVNALVFRLHAQSKKSSVVSRQSSVKKLKTSDKGLATHKEFSILYGRSMCPDCRHELAARDLVPVLSWLSLRGKCRYCGAPISWQYPLVELLTVLLFILSYIYWPVALTGGQWVLFALWLMLLVGFMALTVYDLRWMLLPNKIIYPLTVLAGIYALANVLVAKGGLNGLLGALYGLLIGGGMFYVLFQVSKGRWIGGGDVKLGAILGLLAGGPLAAILTIFLASTLGSLVSVPLLLAHRAGKNSRIPFGPFLILGAIIVRLFGVSMLTWYKQKFLLLG